MGSSDEETQKKGIVFVMWGKGSPRIPDAGGDPSSKLVLSFVMFGLFALHFLSHSHEILIPGGRRMMECLPVRVASIHQSFDDTPVLRLLRAVLVAILLGADKKIRLQCHFEDDWEIRYKLLGFGIPVDSE